MPVDEQATNKNGAQPDQQVAGKPENEKKPDDGKKPGAEKKQDEEKKPDAEKKPMEPAKKRLWIVLSVVLGVAIVVGGVLFYLHSLTYESTDDAQIDGHLNPIASRVAGTVKAVYVENDQPVKAGDTLVDLDPRDYQASVAQARAQYEQALAQLQAQNPNVPIQQSSNTSNVSTDTASVVNAEALIASAQFDYDSNVAKLRQAEATNRKNQSDLVRYRELAAKHEIALSDFDQYVATAAAQEATVEANRTAAESSRKVVDQRRAQLQQQQAKLQEDSQNAPRQVAIRKADITSSAANAASTKAQLDMALLNLSYCHIVAPVDGIASQRSAEVGGQSRRRSAACRDRSDADRLGDGEFQRDATGQDARRPAGDRSGGFAQPGVRGKAGVHAGRNRRQDQSFSSRRCDRELCEGGAEVAAQDQPGPQSGELQQTASGYVGGGESVFGRESKE